VPNWIKRGHGLLQPGAQRGVALATTTRQAGVMAGGDTGDQLGHVPIDADKLGRHLRSRSRMIHDRARPVGLRFSRAWNSAVYLPRS
jgi:hypothetical protein